MTQPVRSGHALIGFVFPGRKPGHYLISLSFQMGYVNLRPRQIGFVFSFPARPVTPHSMRNPGSPDIWIPVPRFRGDKFTPATAGAGMTGGGIEPRANWLCFFGPEIGIFSRNPFIGQCLRQFGRVQNWLCFFILVSHRGRRGLREGPNWLRFFKLTTNSHEYTRMVSCLFHNS